MSIRSDTTGKSASHCQTTLEAIAAGLAKGDDPLAAVRAAKVFIAGAIEHSLELGKGHGPVNPMFRRES